MRPLLNPSPQLGVVLGRSAIALLLAFPMILPLGLPAQASFLETLRGIFTGDTGEGARGNARGASLRDRRCGVEGSGVDSGEGKTVMTTTDSITSNTERLILLAPNTGQSKN